MFRQIVFLILVASISAALIEKQGDRPARLQNESPERDESTQTERDPVGTAEMLLNLSKVQKAQADTFHHWSEQFGIFKNNILKYVEKSKAAIQKHNQRISTIERVIKKIAAEFD